jgi:hypothetical protein
VVAFGPDRRPGDVVVSGGDDRAVGIWDPAGQAETLIQDCLAPIYAMALTSGRGGDHSARHPAKIARAEFSASKHPVLHFKIAKPAHGARSLTLAWGKLSQLRILDPVMSSSVS